MSSATIVTRRNTAVAMAVSMCLVISPHGWARAGTAGAQAEPVQLFAFDVDPGCAAPDCIPQDGAFYPGRAQKQGSEFSGDALTVPQGTDISFTNLSSEHHNIVAFKRRHGKPLFESEAHVTQGMTSEVSTQYLQPGTYSYFCGHHPTTMFGVIEVTATG